MYGSRQDQAKIDNATTALTENFTKLQNTTAANMKEALDQLKIEMIEIQQHNMSQLHVFITNFTDEIKKEMDEIKTNMDQLSTEVEKTSSEMDEATEVTCELGLTANKTTSQVEEAAGDLKKELESHIDQLEDTAEAWRSNLTKIMTEIFPILAERYNPEGPQTNVPISRVLL